MLSIGFDPSFVDTLVRVENKEGNLEKELPLPGHHHRSPSIIRIAGGNGVNVSAMLAGLNIDHKLVVPCDQEFEILLNKRQIKSIVKIDCPVNNSVGITWSAGEMQFNDAKHGPGKNHWTQEVHKLWNESPLQCYLNWGLNPNSLEWISTQWLATCGWSYDEIISTSDVVRQALRTDQPLKSILLEPGSVKSHKDQSPLRELLNHIASNSQNLDYAVFSSNEEEFPEYSQVPMKQFVLHTSEFVELKTKEKSTKIMVPKLQKEPTTFVGAGDAFIAGIVKSILDMNFDPKEGINVAQMFLHGEL